jgi:pre-mRNA-splicing factor SYF2
LRALAARKKFSRRRQEFDQEDVTYINERNKVFNKKIKRAYDKYTVEIRQNLERGTAL